MSKEPRGLGKGLSALLGEVQSADQLRKPVGYVNKDIAGRRSRESAAEILRVPVDQIVPNPYQPRKSFDQAALEELASSVRTLGLIQPLTVRRVSDDRYQIISGERRFKACCMAGMTSVPAYVRDANDQGMLEMAIVENVQRENLDPIELAMSYQRLMEECSLTQDEMAERVGKKRATIANTLRLLKLPAKVQYDLKVGLLSTGHAKALLSLDDARTQEELCDVTVNEGLSVRQLEALVRKMAANPAPHKAADKVQQVLPDEYNRLAGQMERYFSKGITLHRNASGKGTMTVRFSSDEEVRALLRVLEESVS